MATHDSDTDGETRRVQDERLPEEIDPEASARASAAVSGWLPGCSPDCSLGLHAKSAATSNSAVKNDLASGLDLSMVFLPCTMIE